MASHGHPSPEGAAKKKHKKHKKRKAAAIDAGGGDGVSPLPSPAKAGGRDRLRMSVAAAADEQAAVVFFGNGSLAPGRGNKRLRLGYYRNTQKHQETARLLVAESDRMEYRGKHHPNYHEGDIKYLVGVVDKKASELRLHPAKLFTMGLHVKGAGPLPTGERDLTSINQKRSARKQLIEEFGGKRKKSAIRTAERSRLTADTLAGVSELMTHKLAESAVGQVSKEEMEAEADKHRPVPKFNKDAKKAEDVYPLKNLITGPELTAMKACAKSLAKTKSKALKKLREANTYCEFVLGRIEAFKELSPATRTDKARVLLYLQYLVVLYQRVGYGKVKMEALDDALPDDTPDFVKMSILKKFMERARPGDKVFHISVLKRDLLLSYILILALTCCDFHPVGIEEMALSIGEKPSKIITQFRSVGCTVHGSGKRKKGPNGEPAAPVVRRAALMVPLTFPKARVIPQRG